ncbi:hypothetical protein QT381_04530 [Galbitalea sp. SE-J8]|uniref:hypothetical protein n=1 Tax=Galbitalea sp. SE-J8 TaxID=3054952 RepID=UPI00259D0CF8|nr:hypothetical protein [Galbitalea sp. SE-J8]MDM4762270.1 hypothetical protein [Galbitalea sp. SE-J8]
MRTAALAAPLGVGAAAISLVGAGVPSAWGDEAVSLMSAQRDWPSLARMLLHADGVHGAYYALLHLWLGVTGVDPLAARSLSALAIGAAAAGVVVLGRRAGRTRWGVLAAVVVVSLPRLSWAATEARSSALSAALAVWLVVAALGIARPAPRRRSVVLYVVVLALSMLAFVYTALLVAVPLIVAAALAGRRHALRVLAWSALGVLLAAPVVVVAIAQRGQIGWVNGSREPVLDALVEPWFLRPLPAVVGWCALLAAAALAIARGIRSRSATQRATDAVAASEAGDAARALGIATAVWVVVPIVVILLLTLAVPVFTPRYLTFTAPGVALAVGWLVDRVLARRAWLGVLLLVVVVAAAVPADAAERQPGAKDGSDWASVAAQLARDARPGDGILYDEAAPAWRLPREIGYAYPGDVEGLVDLGVDVDFRDSDGLRGTALAGDALRRSLASGGARVWYVAYLGPQASDLAALGDAGYRLRGETRHGRDAVLRFDRA